MSIRRIKCPSCGKSANVPAAMAKVRCPNCSNIWDPKEPEEDNEDARESGNANRGPKAKRKSKSGGSAIGGAAKLVGTIAGSLLVVSIVAGAVWYWRQSNVTPDPFPQPPATEMSVIGAGGATSFREVNLPEPTRLRIYQDLKKAANTTIDKPIMIPKNSAARAALDQALGATFDREITMHATMNNVTDEDIWEIINEGNTKQWK